MKRCVVRIWFLSSCFILISFFARAQHLPLNHQFNIHVEKYMITTKSQVHTAFRPYIFFSHSIKTEFDSIAFRYNKFNISPQSNKHKWFWRKLLYEDFIIVDEKDFTLKANPLIYLETGFSSDGMLAGSLPLSVNTRGLELKGKIGKNLYYHTKFFENQAFFIDYLKNYIDTNAVVPGQGAVKIFQTDGFDYSRAEGYLSMNIPFSKIAFNIDFGHGKHFIGHGYRSLLLSDNTFSYPYFRFSTKFRRLQYVSIWASLQSFNDVYYNQHFRRHATFNYLSWKQSDKFEAGLFEAIIWQTSDDKTYKNRFVANFFNPVIFSRLFSYGLNDKHNILLGANLNYTPVPAISLYGQAVIDNLQWKNMSNGKGYFQNKYGGQVGVKFYGSKNSVLRNLFMQAELNAVRPYTYGHQIARQNYQHYNQPLAHPLGAGFIEQFAIIRYTYKSILLSAKYSKAKLSADANNSHNGSNIFIRDIYATKGIESYNNTIAQAIEQQISNMHFSISYIVNPATNLKLFAGYKLRLHSKAGDEHKTPYLFFGICSDINNYYYDF